MMTSAVAKALHSYGSDDQSFGLEGQLGMDVEARNPNLDGHSPMVQGETPQWLVGSWPSAVPRPTIFTVEPAFSNFCCDFSSSYHVKMESAQGHWAAHDKSVKGVKGGKKESSFERLLCRVFGGPVDHKSAWSLVATYLRVCAEDT